MKCPAEVCTPATRRPPLSRPAGTGLSFPRQDYPRHQLRADLSPPQENQSQHGLCWSGCRYQGNRGRYLAGQLYGVRSRLHRSGGRISAASRKSFWPKSVTYASGPDLPVAHKHHPSTAAPLMVLHRPIESAGPLLDPRPHRCMKPPYGSTVVWETAEGRHVERQVRRELSDGKRMRNPSRRKPPVN